MPPMLWPVVSGPWDNVGPAPHSALLTGLSPICWEALRTYSYFTHKDKI